MSENQRWGVTRRNAVKREADIGVADTATCHLYDNLVSTRAQSREFAGLQSSARPRQLKSVSSLHTHHSGPFRFHPLELATICNPETPKR